MDEIVKLAMAKWPKVPHCYGWLALDARGQWRMRDERAQALNLPGDPIRNLALQQFINRNYEVDTEGRWHFQNGPQKVYVDLDCTPYIAQLLPNQEWRLHTGQLLKTPQSLYLLDDGNLVLRHEKILAQIDDRDLSQTLEFLVIDGSKAQDEQLSMLFDTAESFLQKHRVELLWQGERVPLLLSTLPALLQELVYQAHARPEQSGHVD